MRRITLPSCHGLTETALARLIVAVGVAGLLGGCAATAGTTATSNAAPSAPTSSSPPAQPAAAASAPPGGSARVVRPGTSLAVGQSANVLYRSVGSDTGPTWKLKVTVQSIRTSNIADFTGFRLTSAERTRVPDYANVQIVNLGPRPLTGSADYPAIPIDGIDTAGDTAQSVTFYAPFAACPDNSAPDRFAPGQSFHTCLTYLVPGGITKVIWTGTDSYIDSPVSWTPK
jgi:hypothetical protein